MDEGAVLGALYWNVLFILVWYKILDWFFDHIWVFSKSWLGSQEESQGVGFIFVFEAW